MKNFKKFTAAVLATVITAGSVIATGIATSAASTDFTVQYCKNNWSSIINAERQKYPQTVNGRQCYWNNHNLESYTFTPCDHKANGISKCNTIKQEDYYDSASYKRSADVSVGLHGSEAVLDFNCCMAFARKLQYDVFKTKSMVRFKLRNGVYSLPDGTKMLYYPQAGDLVRIEKDESNPERFPGHSVFLSNVSSDYRNISIGQVNAHSTCAIEWNSTTYGPKNEKIDLTYIRCYASYVERPMIEGDINLDGEINAKDATIFKNTIMKDGKTYYNCPLGMYDINHDGKVDTSDYYDILYGNTSNAHYFDNTRSVTTDWVECGLKDSFCADGLFYQKTGSTTVRFVGPMNSKQTSVTVPSSAKDPATGTSYTVTEIGIESTREPATKFIYNIETLSIPTTVTKIGQRALYGCKISRLTIPSGSKLATIGDEAFYNTKLSQVSFSSAKSLTSIGNYAFKNCSVLRDFIAPYSLRTIGKEAFANCKGMLSFKVEGNSSQNCYLTLIDDNAFTGCTSLQVVEIANDLSSVIRFGSSTGIFDSACRSKLYLPNTNSVAGYLYLKASDRQLMQNGKMTVFAGKYRFFNENNSVFLEKTSTAFEKVNF